MGKNNEAATIKKDTHQLWLALLSGTFLWLSYPPFRVGWLAWVALVPLSAAALISSRASRPTTYHDVGAALLGGALWGFGLFHPLLFTTEGALYEQLGGLIVLTVLLATICAVYYVFLKAFFVRWSQNNWIVVLLAASAWVAVEFIIRWLAVGFAPYIGVTQWRQPALLALASVVGIHGIGWIVVAVNVTLLIVLDRATGGKLFHIKARRGHGDQVSGQRRHRVFIAAALCGVVATAGAAMGGFPAHRLDDSAAHTSSGPLRLLLVQPNITNEQYYRIDRTDEGHYDVLDLLVAQTESALANVQSRLSTADGENVTADGGPLLVVWPETVLHMPGENDLYVQEAISMLTSRWDTELVMGMPRREPAGTIRATDSETTTLHNSVFIYEPGGKVKETYDKIHVIPIAEAQFTAGKEVTVVNYDEHFLGIGVCSDVVVPQHARRTVLAGAHTLHYVASFGQVSRLAPLATALAMFRAAEHRVHVVQTATTGPSLVIDPQGRLIATTEPDRAATLAVNIPAVAWRPTLYTRFGDWIVVVSGLLIAATMFWTKPYERNSDGTLRLGAVAKTNR